MDDSSLHNSKTGPKTGIPWFKRTPFVLFVVFVGLALIGKITEINPPVPKPVVKNAYNIKDNIYFDDEIGGWSWTPYFQWPASPGTKVQCDVTAFDKNGKSVVADSFNGNVLNNGVVIYYGELRDTTSRAIAKSIRSYKVTCTE